MNPPYTAGIVDRFIEKLLGHSESGEVNQAIVLVNNATDTKWFQSLAEAATAMCFPSGRIRFLDADGNPGAPLQGQALVYLGGDPNGFVNAFQEFGFCCEVLWRD